MKVYLARNSCARPFMQSHMTPGSSELGYPQANIRFAQMNSNNRICFLQKLARLLGCSQPRACADVKEYTSICGMFAISSHFCFLLQLHPVLAPAIPLPACGRAPGMPSNSSSAAGCLSVPVGLASLFVEEKIKFGWE